MFSSEVGAGGVLLDFWRARCAILLREVVLQFRFAAPSKSKDLGSCSVADDSFRRCVCCGSGMFYLVLHLQDSYLELLGRMCVGR